MPRKKRTLAERFWEKVDIREWEPGSCWEWRGTPGPSGYGVIGRGSKHEGLILAHRAAYELTQGPIPSDGPGYHGWVVRHRCDNRLCVNPSHLELGSQADNVEDSRLRGGVPRGVGHHNARLTPDKVRRIRRSPESAAALAAQFGVTKWNIYSIRQGRIWRHIS